MTHLPPNATPLNPIHAQTLAAVLNGARTTREVQHAGLLASTHTAHERLAKTKAAGLINYEHGKLGTLRPAVRIVWPPQPKRPRDMNHPPTTP